MGVRNKPHLTKEVSMCWYCDTDIIEKAVERNDEDFFDANAIAVEEDYYGSSLAKVSSGYYLMGDGSWVYEHDGTYTITGKSARVNYCPVCGRKL